MKIKKEPGLCTVPVHNGWLYGISVQLFLIFILSSSADNCLKAAGTEDRAPVITDTSHYSSVFGEIRNFRIFLPPDYYADTEKRYPVIYFFHGWSQRYFGPVGDDYSNYDRGEDNNGDNIANYVAEHDVIVVKADGFNPVSDDRYELTPYNECYVTTYRQFPLYFPEITGHIDNTYRTLADRNHRAVCGLSMGGFMSYWVAGKYPDMISAAGNFCGSSEFMAGPSKFPVDYKILDMYRNYKGVNLRFHYGNTDNLRAFHLDMDRVWREIMDNYLFKVYNAAHSTCGLGDMFDFCLDTFRNPPDKPEKWTHADVYPAFTVWDYQVTTDRFRPGFTILEDVTREGFKCSVREFLPDGETMPYISMSVTTPPVYGKNTKYTICDISPDRSGANYRTITSDNSGRLKINTDGGLHHFGISRTELNPNLAIASVNIINMPWAVTRQEVVISVSILNKGTAGAGNVRAVLTPVRNYVKTIINESDFGNIEAGATAVCKNHFSFLIEKDSVEIVKFNLTITDGENRKWEEAYEIPVRNNNPLPDGFEIADGRLFTVARAGILSETLVLGSGNGDGEANPGESIVILARYDDRYWRTNIYTSDKYVNQNGINIREKDFWDQFGGIGSSPKYSVPVISSGCPRNHSIEFFTEFWIPSNRFHIIRQGTAEIVVKGKDTSPPVISWIDISGSNRIQTKIFDGGKVIKVMAKLLPVTEVAGLGDVNLKNPERIAVYELNDEGKEGDITSGDRVFSKKITPPATYFYRVEIEASDNYGNKISTSGTQVFLVHSD